MPTARQELATAVLNGKIYVIGGYDSEGRSTSIVEVYNPATDRWTTAQPVPVAVNHNSAAVAGGKLYSFGAAGSTASVYNPGSDSWSLVASMALNHGGTPAVGVFEDKIYVAGGTHNDPQSTRTLRELEVYDTVANTWTTRAPMNVARHHTGGAFLDGKFYVVAGRGGNGSSTALEVYDPATNSWSARAPLPTGRSGVGVAAVNGELWVFGGEVPGALQPEVEAYNPATNSWRRLPDMPAPHHGIFASTIGDRIYLIGGGNAENISVSNANQVFTVQRKGTFANISSRLKIETDDRVLIGGFIVTGSGRKRIIVRAPGPSLPLNGALADPTLELYNGAGQLLATNDDWGAAPNRQEIADSALAPSHPREPAILTTLAPGNYTAVVRGAGNFNGTGLVEVYDLEAGSTSRLANISTRGFVQTADDVLIGGLILSGHDPIRVLVRAIGPSLPLAGALANPTVDLHDQNGMRFASNDNWRDTQEAEILATTIPPGHELESAIVQTLPPSNYTAVVRGVGNSTGIAVVEAYSLD